MRTFTPFVLIVALIACRKTESRIPNQQLHRVTRNASLSMVVSDTASAIDKITAAAESAGGYVCDTRLWRDGEQLRGTITARIPDDRLTPSLAVIRGLAVRIQSETIQVRK